MAGGADAGRTEIELAGIGARQRYQLLQSLGLHIGIDDNHHRHVGDVRYGTKSFSDRTASSRRETDWPSGCGDVINKV